MSDPRADDGESASAAAKNADLPTAEEQMEAVGLGRFNYIVLLTLVLFNVAYGMEILVTNISYRALPRIEWGMTDDDRARLISVSYAGFIVGAFTAGFSADIYGRKPLVFIHSALFIPFAIWSSLANNLVVMYVTRVVIGFSIGIILPVSVSLIAELSVPSQRGWMIIAVPALGFVAGQALVLFVGIAAMRSNVECEDDCGWWRWVFSAGVIPDAIALGLFLAFVPESPRFLLYNDRVEEAEAVIRSIAESNETVDQLKQGGRVRPLDKEGRVVSPWDLFVPPLRQEILGLTFMWTMFGFGLYTLNFIVPIILDENYHLNSFQQFSVLFFYVISEGMSILIVLFIVDLPHFGRIFFLLSFSVAAIPFLVGCYFALDSGLVLICSFLFIAKAALGAAYQSTYVYAAELLPTSHRSMGIGIANGASKIAAVAGPPIAIAIADAVGIGTCFLVMAALVAAGALALVLHSTETIGRALADIAPPGDAQEESDGAARTPQKPTERTPLL